jgi:hypothetical protein
LVEVDVTQRVSLVLTMCTEAMKWLMVAYGLVRLDERKNMARI